MTEPSIDELPGFRRRIKITPTDGQVRSEVEDDFHRMTVIIHHDAGVAKAIEAKTLRAPWSTCPGAEAKLEQTFVGAELANFGQIGAKKANCTHLFDLAVYGAAHAAEPEPTVYDLLASDPIEGKALVELRKNGEPVLSWILHGFVIERPKHLAGKALTELRGWIEGLPPQEAEQARILQWGSMIAHGRLIPFEKQSDATQMPANCFTFQPKQAVEARRVGRSIDFSAGTQQPLGKLE